MCGISGIVNHNRRQPVDRTLLQSISETMAHRGPDGHREQLMGAVGFAHRRLSIIDIGGGSQPMGNEDGSIWVTFNGEIYNFRELRRQLEASGHRFASSSDTEVIVHAYEEWGEEAVGRLHGMFAFGIWDEVRQVLLVARDRVGIKPLYYANTKEAFVFASELKALLKHPAVPREINPLAIDRFLTYYYTAGSATPFSAIQKLEPGHYLVLQDGQVRSACYWSLEHLEPWTRSFDEAVDSLQDLLRRTVRDHLVSDVPVGVLLSGGVDSTAVLRYAAAERQPLHTFTVGFDGEGFPDERPFAALAAAHFRTLHQNVSLTENDFLDFLPRYVWHMEEPVCEPPAVALYHVSRRARDCGVKVLLSGEGGDEAFAGYQTYRNLVALERVKSLGAPVRAALKAVLRFAGGLGMRRLTPYVGLVERPLSDYYYSRTATPETAFNQLKPNLYTEEFASALGRRESGEVTREFLSRMKDRTVLDRMLYVDSKTWLPDDLLVKADKMTMATSVELRVPLLDHAILEFAAALPQSFKLRGISGKRILKAALRGGVPTDILTRKKAGFPVPYSRWLRADRRRLLRDTVLASNAAVSQYFESAAVRGLIDEFSATGAGSKEVFCLLVLELWFQQFANLPPAKSNFLSPAISTHT